MENKPVAINGVALEEINGTWQVTLPRGTSELTIQFEDGTEKKFEVKDPESTNKVVILN